LAIDPPSKNSGAKTPRFQSNIALTTHDHPRHNGIDELGEKRGAPSFFLINGPGEYETKGIRINGIKCFHDAESGKKYGVNTAYVIEIENTRICHLGDFGEEKLRAQTKEKIGKIDILLLPIGGETVAGPEKSVEIINALGPNIVVPMHYENKKLKEFLKEFGEESLKPVEKLTVKKKDISDGEKVKIVVLESNIK